MIGATILLILGSLAILFIIVALAIGTIVSWQNNSDDKWFPTIGIILILTILATGAMMFFHI